MAAKRSAIGLTLATAIGLGAIIGAGIFVLSGTAIAIAGIYALVAFVLVGIVALIVAMEFGELTSMFPNAKGGSYSYVYEAFGSELAFITGIISYLGGATSISVVALGFGSYLSSLLSLHAALYAIPFAIAMILVLSLVNIIGMKKAAQTDLMLVIIKVCVLVLFIAFAFYLGFGKANFGIANIAAPLSKVSVAAILGSSIAIFFAYSGFGTITRLTSSAKGGSHTAVRAMVLAVLISIVLYTLVTLALMMLAPASSYAISANPFSYALQHAAAPGWLMVVIDIGALVATASAAIAMILGASGTIYQMGVDRLLPHFTTKYNNNTGAAINGILISAAIAIVMLFAGNIYIIAAIASFGMLFSYLIMSFAIVHFRYNKTRSSFRMPFYPYLTVIAITMLLVFIVGIPRESLIIGIIAIILLLTGYYLLREIEQKKVVKVKLFR